MAEILGKLGRVKPRPQVMQIVVVVAAEPAGNVQSARRCSRRLAQDTEGLDQMMQPFFGTDTGEIANDVRRFLTLGRGSAMTGQVEAGVNYVEAFASNAEIAGHELGIIRAGGDEAVDLTAVVANQTNRLGAKQLGQGSQKDIVPLERAKHRNSELPLDLMNHAGNQGVGKTDDLGLDFVGQPAY